ncbi:hypothetical protein CB1_000490001 [Camelus ferus]|nr:hypothetical protein CB1_000490001 [Camelus ferus]
MPTDDYSEESDTDLSQKSDGPASPVEGPKDPSCPKDSGLTSVGTDTFRLQSERRVIQSAANKKADSNGTMKTVNAGSIWSPFGLLSPVLKPLIDFAKRLEHSKI